MVVSCAPPTGDLARNQGMCCDWELKWQPFSLQARAQSTDLHQPGVDYLIYLTFIKCFLCRLSHFSSQQSYVVSRYFYYIFYIENEVGIWKFNNLFWVPHVISEKPKPKKPGSWLGTVLFFNVFCIRWCMRCWTYGGVDGSTCSQGAH